MHVILVRVACGSTEMRNGPADVEAYQGWIFAAMAAKLFFQLLAVTAYFLGGLLFGWESATTNVGPQFGKLGEKMQQIVKTRRGLSSAFASMFCLQEFGQLILLITSVYVSWVVS